jgi:fucose permease
MLTVPVMTAFSGVFALGVMFSILGSIKLKLAEQLNINDAQAGRLISTLMFSSMVCLLIIGPLTDLLGFKLIALVGFGSGAVCVWLLASAKSYNMALVACLFLGGAAMCVNTVGNTLGPNVLFGGESPAAASNLLNVFFGIGAFITPLIVVTLLKKVGYKATVGLIGAILLIPIFYTIAGTFPPPPEGFQITQAVSLLANPGVLMGGLSLFCYISLEITLAGFITTYLKSHEISDEKAGTVLSGFWIALMIARLIAAFTVGGGMIFYFVPVLAVVTMLSISGMVMAKTPGIGIVTTLVTGLAIGPIFPTIVGVTFSKTGVSASVFGIIFAMGLLGGILVPSLIGKYAAEMNIRKSLRILVGMAAGLIVMSAILGFAIPDAVPDEPPAVEAAEIVGPAGTPESVQVLEPAAEQAEE